MRSSATDQSPNSNENPGLGPIASTSSPSVPPPLPWQVPGDDANAPVFNTAETETNKSGGGFPVVIFVVIILGIVVAVGVFLYIQGALPFGG